MEGLVVGVVVLPPLGVLGVGEMELHVSTAQKGPADVEGVALKVHPELAKIFRFLMRGIVFLHAHKFWLNAVASLNMPSMLVTEPTFHAAMSWLNADAPLNM